jgi:hypothetical protein
MVNNLTNINKTKYHFSPSLTKHKKTTTLEIQVMSYDMHTNVAELYRLMGSQPSSSW